MGSEMRAETTIEGLRIPPALESTNAVSFVLTQQAGKLKPKDLKVAIERQREIRAQQKAEQEALRALRLLPGDHGTPQLISGNVGGSVGASQLRGEYEKKVAIKADKQCQLSEVTSCWAKLPDGRVGAQVDCPDHVMKGRDTPWCATLRINALGQCLAAEKKRARHG